MKKERKEIKVISLSLIALMISAIFLFAGCGSGVDDNSMASVSINFRVPSAQNRNGAVMAGAVGSAAVSVPAVVRSIKIQITASGMTDITETFDVQEGEVVIKSYSVPSNTDIVVRAEAYDGAGGTGVRFYAGETSESIQTVGVTVNLNMVLSYIAKALGVFETGDIGGSVDLFSLAVSEHEGENSDSEAAANFFYAITRILSRWSDMQSFDMTYDDTVNDGLYDFRDIVDAITYVSCGSVDCDNDFKTIGDPVDAIFAGIVCPQNLLNDLPAEGDGLLAFFNNVLRPELEAALDNLDNVSITGSFNNRWTNNISWEKLYGAEVESDYADVLYFRAMAGAAVAVLETEDAVLAKAYAASALNDIEAAMTRINTMETDPQGDDWVDLIDMDPVQQLELIAGIATARGCLGY